MKAKKLISVILTGIVAASMLAGCGSSNSKSQTDNTESSSQNEAGSSSASETADATDTPESTETPAPAATDDSSATAAAEDTESPEKLWLYIIPQQELLQELRRQSQMQQAVIYSKSSRWNLIQMMIWIGQMMTVVYPENMTMKV